MKRAARPWAIVLAGLLALSVGSGAIANEFRSTQSNYYMTVSALPKAELFIFEETCSEKLMAYINAKGMGGNNLFRKSDRTYFEAQTGCIVEDTNAVVETTGLYALEYFPGLKYFGYEVLDAFQVQPGGSYGSIPAWTVQVLLEYEIDHDSDWGLCGKYEGGGFGDGATSADWNDPSWAAYAAQTYIPRNSDFQGWPGNEYFKSRYSISIYKEILISDQQGPVVNDVVWACGTDVIFQNALDEGYHQINTKFYLDPADLKEYGIPFYSWMGW